MKNLCGSVIALISSPLVELATAAVELFPFDGKTQAARPHEQRVSSCSRSLLLESIVSDLSDFIANFHRSESS